MKILIKTTVEQDYKTVFNRFDEALFLALKPPLLPLTLRQFDGSMEGDEVKITLGKGFLSQDWDALIIEQAESEDEIYFIDKGVKLPFFLKTWRHRHRILKLKNGKSEIIDDIEYSTPLGKPMDFLMFPLMYLQFLVRKPVYKRYFK
jgi:ligand-binding SRPBCC domain-containing protein